MTLMTTQDVAAHFGVSKRRIQAKVNWLREDASYIVGTIKKGIMGWPLIERKLSAFVRTHMSIIDDLRKEGDL